MNSKFYPGDTVRVSNPMLKTYRKTGRVLSTNCTTVEVDISGLPILKYNQSNLALVSRGGDFDYKENRPKTTNNQIVNNKENDNMCVKGNYSVAMVNFVQGVNTTKHYAFALFDNNTSVDDTVLVDSTNGYGVAVIREIYTKAEYEALGCSLPTKEVICKIDFKAFDERKEKREKAKKLKADMDNMVKSLQEIAVYEMLANQSPELRAMLDEYKAVIE